MRKIINRLKTIWSTNNASGDTTEGQSSATPLVVERHAHSISRKNISPNCRKVLHRLRKGGYDSYLVGGSVRDLLLGHEPKDFDVVTNATPEQVRKLFRNCRLIGRRFRLAHIYFKNEIIEVATYRANAPANRQVSQAGLVLRDNTYGHLEDDVIRRDFTINALLYNIKDFTVIDYTGGMEDLQKGIIKLIGEPATRYREDPVRILRAIRFAAKLGFRLEENTAAPIAEYAPLLSEVPPARLLEEMNKLFLSGNAATIFSLLLHYNLFHLLFPSTQASLNDTTFHLTVDKFLQAVLQATDARINQGKPATPAFLVAAMLWHPMLKLQHQYQAEGFREMVAIEKATNDTLMEENRVISIPKRMSHMIREIWFAQRYLEVRKGNRPFRMIQHPRFRAAYDFFVLRAEAEPNLKEIADWWTEFSRAKKKHQQTMIESLQQNKRRKHKPKKKRQNHSHNNPVKQSNGHE